MHTTGKKVARLVSALAAAACLLFVASAQEPIAITIDRIKGTVEVMDTRADAPAWASAVTQQQIGPGWQLRTSEESKVQLIFPEDNVVILRENSVLRVDGLSDGGGASLFSDEGSLLVNIRNALSKDAEFTLTTPAALAVVRGTKYGAYEIDEYDVTFFGYHGTVQIFDAYGTNPVDLHADETVDVSYGVAPSSPYPSGSIADDFLFAMENESDYLPVENAAAKFIYQLELIESELDDMLYELGDIQEEWDRYERRDQIVHMVFLYSQVLGIERLGDDLMEDFGELGDDIKYNPLSVAQISPIPELLESIGSKFDDFYDLIAGFADEIEPYLDGETDLLDSLDGLIDPGNPALGLRWGLIDTDNDGLSDLDEWGLGLDPLSANDDGFITLVAPDDDAEFNFPDDNEVEFEFEMLDDLKVDDFIRRYNLVIEAGGRQWVRGNADEREDVSLFPLVGPGGAFADQADGDGVVELQWFVQAELNEDQLFQRIAAEQPGFRSGLGSVITSEARTLRIQTPVQVDEIIIDLEPVGPTTVEVGQTARIRGVISEVNALGQWEIEVVYDSSVLEFDTGRRLGLFTGSTVFFGDEPGGIIVISGVAPRTSNGISGEGAIFELDFNAKGEGATTVEVDDVMLFDVLTQPLDADGGEDVEVEVFVPGQSPLAGPSRYGNYRK